MVIHSSNSHPNYLWNIEVGRVRGGEGGDGYLRHCYSKGRVSHCLFQTCLILNLLTRLSTVVTPEDEQKTIMKQHHKVSSHYVTNQSKVWSHFKYAGYKFITASKLHLVASKMYLNMTGY